MEGEMSVLIDLGLSKYHNGGYNAVVIDRITYIKKNLTRQIKHEMYKM